MAHFEFVGEDHIKRVCSCILDECSFGCAMRRTFENKPTNADRIRAMTDAELAKYIDLHTAEAMWCNAPPDDCPPHETCELCILDWLKSAVEVDDG